MRRHPRPPAWAALALCACSAATSGPLGQAALMHTVDVLADPRLEGRLAGSPGEREARRYVVDELMQHGVSPQVQPIGNVYAILPGTSDEVIVVGAHLDHLGHCGEQICRGADDDASGVAAVLGIAETLAHRQLARTVLFVWFTGEEQGLVGSYDFVASSPVPLSKIVAMVNLDMIARPLQDTFWFRLPLFYFDIPRHHATGLVGARHYPGLRALADAAFEGDELVAGEDLPDAIGREVDAQAQDRSDSAAFEHRGIPALFFGDGESSDYHTAGDTPERLDVAQFARRARAIERVVEALAVAPHEVFARSDRTPPKRKPTTRWYVPIGFANGWRTHDGYVLGGAASLVHFSAVSHVYAGLYADALHRDTWRFSAGPEVGWRWFGIDGGYVLEGRTSGFAVRPFATVSLLSLGLRTGYLARWFGELDLLVKVPL
jgi:hypothetical protein